MQRAQRLQWNVDAVFARAGLAGWSDSELARRMGISHSTVSRVRSRAIQPTLAFRAGLMRAFPDTDPDLLICPETVAVPA